MSDKDKDKERQRRLKELEEKKKKLQEYKNRQKTTAVSPDVTRKNIEQITDFEQIIKVADNLSGRTPTSTPTKPAAAETVSTPVKPAANNTEKPSSTIVQTPSKKKVHLVVQKVSSVDIPPKEIEVYNKSIQTVATEEYPEELNARVSPRETMHSESTLVQHKKESDTSTAPGVSNSKEDAPKLPELSQEEKDKILQSVDFSDFITKSSKIIERALYSSSKFDVVIDYADAANDGASKNDDVKDLTLQIKLFDERWSKHRAVTDVDWSPKYPELLVASYSANEQGTNDPDGLVLVWSVQNTLQRPEYRFHCQSPVISTFFDKFSPTIIVGGTYSGQIVLWDTRARTTPVQHTPLSSVGHTHPVYCMNVVGTKNAHNLVSVSTDGKLCVWTLDNLLQPLEVLELHNKQSRIATATAPVAVTSMAFAEGEVNGFFVGSEEGAVFEAYRHGTKSGVYERFDGHHGPVTGIDFHPASGPINFSDLFITASTDWTCKLWNAKVGTKPLYSFEEADDYIYDVRWCPSHPSMFATVDGTGSLDLWDLNEETEIPILKTPVSQRALNRLKWSADGKRILTGDSLGALYVYDCGEICTPRNDEWTIFEETLQKMIQVEQDPAPQQNTEKRDV